MSEEMNEAYRENVQREYEEQERYYQDEAYQANAE